LSSCESTRATSNGMPFRDFEVIGVIRRSSESDNCRIDAVSIGCDPLSRSCISQVREIYRNRLGEFELTQMGASFRGGCTEVGSITRDCVIPLERTLEGYLLLCSRRDGNRRGQNH